MTEKDLRTECMDIWNGLKREDKKRMKGTHVIKGNEKEHEIKELWRGKSVKGLCKPAKGFWIL